MSFSGRTSGSDKLKLKYVEKVVDLTHPSNNVIHNMSVEEAKGILLSGDPEKVKTIVVRNKIDLADNKDELLGKNRNTTEVFLSAKTGEGFDVLVQKLKIIMGIGDTSEDSYMARARHLNALSKTQGYLTMGRQRLENKNTLELLAEDLRMAQESLGTITGSFVADDLLGEIFSKFCIGK